jgi:glycerophosphoryl diester phosphodiesterase
VISARGRLAAGRDHWPRWLAGQLFRGHLVTWVHQHKLLILAWTVNDSQRLNQLVRLHVDGITTANLAILRALG